MHSCIPPPTCPFYEAGMPTPLTISFCRLALLPTEAALADGAESVLLQLQWINSPCTNLSTMRVPALRPRFRGGSESSPDLSISPVPRWSRTGAGVWTRGQSFSLSLSLESDPWIEAGAG